MTLPAELQVGRRARAPSGTVTDRDRTRQMVARDRIRLTGRLREGPAKAGPFYVAGRRIPRGGRRPSMPWGWPSYAAVRAGTGGASSP